MSIGIQGSLDLPQGTPKNAGQRSRQGPLRRRILPEVIGKGGASGELGQLGANALRELAEEGSTAKATNGDVGGDGPAVGTREKKHESGTEARQTRVPQIKAVR